MNIIKFRTFNWKLTGISEIKQATNQNGMLFKSMIFFAVLVVQHVAARDCFIMDIFNVHYKSCALDVYCKEEGKMRRAVTQGCRKY